jgi:signal transduction histidine kinase/ligand-binding sensor domain-containing protein
MLVERSLANSKHTCSLRLVLIPMLCLVALSWAGSVGASPSQQANALSPLSQADPGVDLSTARFQSLSTAEGLSYPSVTTIHQDPRGFMWFGTQSGLNKYDGYQFTVYRHDPSDSSSLAADYVFALYSDPDGTLWVGTSEGLDRLERVTGTFVHLLAGRAVTSILRDDQGTLWAGTDDGLWSLEPRAADLVEHFPYDPERPDDPGRISSDVVMALLEDDQGVLWIGTLNGLDGLAPDRRSIVHYRADAADLNSLTDPRVTALSQDGAGHLWIGTQGGGLYRLLPASGIFLRFGHRLDDAGSVSDGPVTAILPDTAGTLWVGTYDGLNLLIPGQNRFLHLRRDPGDPSSLGDDLVTSLFQDRSGVLWIGTILSGVSKYDARAGWFQTFQPGDGGTTGLSDRVITAIEEDATGAVWLGTVFGGINRLDPQTGGVAVYTYDPDDPDGLRSTRVDAIFSDRQGTIWAGTDNGWLERYDPESDRFVPVHNLLHPISQITETRAGDLIVGTQNGAVRIDKSGIAISLSQRLGGRFVSAIYEDGDGMLWVGTQCGGVDVLSRVDEATRRPGEPPYRAVSHYEHDPADPASLGHDCANSIWEDPADPGFIWIATWGGGLDRFDRATGAFSHYTVHEGLPTDMASCVIGDTNGYLWIGGGSGLVRLDPRTETFRVFDEAEGVPPSVVVSCTAGPSGRFYFGGVDGLVAFDPAVIQDSPQPPPIVINAFRLFSEVVERDLSPGELIELSHDANFVSFDFAALDYLDPAKNQYAYRMDNLDPDWVYAGTRRYADYPNLAPGDYVFRVRGSNSDGVWNEEGTIVRLRIRPPFWATWWFRSSAGLLVVAALVGGVRLRLRSIESRNRELAQQVEQRTREIERRRRVAEGLRDILAVLNSDRPLDEVLDYTVAQSRELMGAEAAVLHRLQPGARWVDIETSSGLPARLASLEVIPFPASGADEAILDRQPFAIPDLAAAAGPDGAHAAGGLWLDATRELYGSFLAVPVVVGGVVDRSLAFYFSAPQTFSDERIGLAVTLADQASLAIANAQLRAQVEQSAVAEERSRLARELHDSVTQSLYSLTLLAEAGQRTAGAGQLESAQRYLARLGEIGQQALREMRLLVYQLRPLALQEEGLVGALQQRLDAVERRAGVEARLVAEGDLSLSPAVEEALYRIAQEALNNALKHASPTVVEVTIRAESGRVELRVSDNGRGFDAVRLPDEGGLGLVSMRERAERVGGSFDVQSTPGAGTEVRVVVGGTVAAESAPDPR